MRTRAAFLCFALALVAASAAARAGEGEALRVVSLLPSVEDALRDVEGVALVAGVRRSFTAPERRDVLDLGSPHDPNVERLARARADLVIGDARIHAHAKADLARFGAEVLLVDTASVEGTFAGLREIGRRIGAATLLAARVEEARAALAGQALDAPVKVLVLFGTPGSFQVVTQGSWLGSLLEALRFENLGAQLSGTERVPGFVSVSHEQLVTLRPELVLLVAHGDPVALRGELQRKLSGSGPWGALGRAATRGVHALAPALFVANPGLDLPRAARELVALAKPSAAVSAP